MEHGSLETKLVALGVAHDRPSVPGMLAELDELRAPTNEPRHRVVEHLPTDRHVEMHPVLRDLLLRDTLEEEARTRPLGVDCGDRIREEKSAVDAYDIRFADDTRLKQPGHELVRALDLVAEENTPPHRQPVRVPGVEGH